MKRTAFGLVMCLAGVLALAAGPAGASAAHRHGPPYGIGLRSYTFVDSSRPTPHNGTYPGAPSRTLPTLLLYPAKGDPAVPAVENAPPLEHGKGFPLLVFAHGRNGSGPSFQFVLDRFVREGFVVAAPTFPLSRAGAPGGVTAADYLNQPGDVSFVLTRVLALARADRSLRKTIDSREIGAVGQSLGATTTLGVATNSCCLDPRIGAAVSLSGIAAPFPGGSYFSEPTPPLLLVHGTADQTLPYAGSVSAYNQAPSPKALLTLEGAPHFFFLYSVWLDPTIRSVTDFLEGFLDHDPQAIRHLADDSDVPGVSSLQEDLTSCRRCG